MERRLIKCYLVYGSCVGNGLNVIVPTFAHCVFIRKCAGANYLINMHIPGMFRMKQSGDILYIYFLVTAIKASGKPALLILDR